MQHIHYIHSLSEDQQQNTKFTLNYAVKNKLIILGVF